MSKKKLTETEVEKMEEDVKIETSEEKEQVLESVQTELDLARKELEETKSLIEAKKEELKLTNRRAYDKQDLDSIDKSAKASSSRSALAKKIEKQKSYDNVVVTGKFLNQRNPGAQVKLPYVKYAEDQVMWHTFDHNKVYNIKRGFADQINEHYADIVHTQKIDNVIQNPNQPGTALEETVVRRQRYAFVPVNF